MHLNLFSLILLLASGITFYVAFLVFKRLGGVVQWWGFLMVAIALWAFSYGIELSCQTLQHMLWCINIEYISISFLPALWMVFVLKFVGLSHLLRLRNLALIFAIPTCTLLLVWTNHYHNWYYQTTTVDNAHQFPLLNIQPAFWYYVHAVFFYCVLGTGILLLIVRFRKANPIYQKQTYIIVASAIIPWIINGMYLKNVRPLAHIDLTPYAFVFSSLLIGVGLLRFNLFNIIPIARDLVFESIEDAVLVVNNTFRVVDYNPAMQAHFAHLAIPLLGASVEDLFGKEQPIIQFLNDDVEEKNTYPTLQLNQQYFNLSVTKLFDKKTVFSGFILLFRNVSAQMLIQQQLSAQAKELAATNQLKDKLFSIIAHDLRTPLINFTEILNMLSDGLLEKADFTNILPVLQRDMAHTTHFMENLLHWSKSQLQGEIVRAENFALNDIVLYVLQLIARNAEEKQIGIQNDISQHLCVYADKNMVQLVLRNLLTNAVKFCNAGNVVTLSAKAEETMVHICVKDNGIGIAPENMQKLFSIETLTTKGSNNEIGTGLGLLLCKEYIDKNNGSISVQSELGKGTTFCFTLPIKR